MGRIDHQETAIFVASLILRLAALTAVGFVCKFLGDIL